ncbi:MAG: hypothetical protein V2A34_04025, partial [Lentisphaerota bacterium]
LKWVAITSMLQAAVVPLVILALYRIDGSFGPIPLGSMAGDGFVMLVSLWLARPWSVWAHGWLTWPMCRKLLAFGGIIAISSTALGLFANALPYFMSLRSYSLEAVGFIGLSSRLSGLFTLTLSTIGSGLYPTLTHIMHQENYERALKWQHLCTRLGVTGMLLALGVYAIVARCLVPLVFGAPFEKAATVIAVGFLSVVPLWFGSQLARLSLLLQKPSVYVYSVPAMFAGFCAVFLLAPPGPEGLPAAWAVFAGASCYAGVSALVLWKHIGFSCPAWSRSLIPMAVAAAALVVSPWMTRWILVVPAAAAWLGIFGLAVWGTGYIRIHEVMEIFKVLRGSKTSETDRCAPASSLPPDTLA